MEKMDKKMVWGIVVAVLVIIAIVIAVKMNNNSATYTSQNNTKQPPAQEQATTTPTPETTTPGGAGNLSYNNALKKYGTNRIQFDATCQAHPNNVTYKAGTQVMFDNRATVSRAINFNGRVFTIAAEGYTVVSMVAAKYPATILVDCGKSQNVATVLIQK